MLERERESKVSFRIDYSDKCELIFESTFKWDNKYTNQLQITTEQNQFLPGTTPLTNQHFFIFRLER